MALAHVCSGCGANLALARPRRDPIYGLPLVWCAGCGRPSVRCLHPIWRRWQELRAAAVALGWLALRLVLVLFMWIVALLATAIVMHSIDAARVLEAWFVGVVVVLFGAVAVSQGVWITTGLSHLSHRGAWLGWAGFLGGVTTVMFLLFGIGLALSRQDRIESLWDWRFTKVLLALLLAGAPIGFPLGRALLKTRRARYLRRERARRRRGAPA
jgi:hypothetical protein